jgi:tetratricopeptide (TPR) repeat protein
MLIDIRKIVSVTVTLTGVVLAAAIGACAPKDDPDSQLSPGLRLSIKGDYDGAIKEYRREISLHPNDGMNYLALGSDLWEKRDYDEAIKEYRIAITLFPFNLPHNAIAALPHQLLGVALQDKGDLDGAIKEYRIAISLDPNNPAYHQRLGTALQTNGDAGGAAQEFRLATPQAIGAVNSLPTATPSSAAMRLRAAVCGAINPSLIASSADMGTPLIVNGIDCTK